jgi:hypothetical protein
MQRPQFSNGDIVRFYEFPKAITDLKYVRERSERQRKIARLKMILFED